VTGEATIRASYDAWTRRDIDSELYHLLEFRDGRIIRLEAFRERDSAMEALGAT
jgi:ketosteroid isomerase-like protein